MLDTIRSTTAMATAQASTDAHLVELWLHGRSVHTQRAYRREAAQLLAFLEQPLPMTTLGDLHAYIDSLEHLAPASQERATAAVKSLLSFGQRVGYLPLNVGAAVRLPPTKDTLAERILSEADWQRMLALETDRRNHALLRLTYATGGRVSEMADLCWRDLQPRDEAGQVTLYGKGGKTRVVLLPAGVWEEVQRLRGAAERDAPVFPSKRSGRHLDQSAAWHVVRNAANRAGLDLPVSPHWLRHAHATHALDRGAPIHLVQATLGHASVATTGRYLHARPTDSSARYLAV